MLIALPDMDYLMSGGWLFDYQFEDALQDNPVIGEGWKFGSARKLR